METNAVTAVLIYLDRKKTRSYVGKLAHSVEKNEATFYFEYDPRYLKHKYAIPLGPDLPLSQKLYKSRSLFPSFQDRIPSKENPAYPDYCKGAGISQYEEDPLVLLSSIGKHGPSSFIFEPELKEKFTANNLKKYRETLNLTIREFAALFRMSASHLQRIESGKFPGKDILKLVEIYEKYPSIALEEIKKNSKTLPSDKHLEILRFLDPNKLGSWSDILLIEEVEFTLSLIKKLKKLDWISKFLNETKIKKSIEAIKGYDLFITTLDENPKIDELDLKKIPMLLRTKAGKIWVYGKDFNGTPQLRVLEEGVGDIEFKDTPYTLHIPLIPDKPEIYFVLNKKYHDHFHKGQIINIKSCFFEIRFACSIYLSGLNFEYEYKPDIKRKKTIDFKIPGKKTKHTFMIELTSLRDSKAVKEHTFTDEHSYDSVNWFSATSSNLGKENSLPELEYIKLQKIILQKTEKFPLPKHLSKVFHIIIIDMRGFLAGISDIEDYKHIVYGGKYVSDVCKRYFKNKTGQELIKGSYENSVVREKIHAIGFILEKNYTPNEIKSKTHLLTNPNLVEKNEEKILEKLFEEW